MQTSSRIKSQPSQEQGRASESRVNTKWYLGLSSLKESDMTVTEVMQTKEEKT